MKIANEHSKNLKTQYLNSMDQFLGKKQIHKEQKGNFCIHQLKQK